MATKEYRERKANFNYSNDIPLHLQIKYLSLSNFNFPKQQNTIEWMEEKTLPLSSTSSIVIQFLMCYKIRKN